jgi:AraC-like DNA-binding protein
MLYLPRQALDEAAKEAGSHGFGGLRDEPGTAIDDPVVRHLLTSLLPAVSNPQQAIASFVDHVCLALAVHVTQAYGDLCTSRSLPRGGLAPWQERRAKELMDASIGERIPLARLAAECGLSVRHFARAFRQSTGVPPHRWLLRLRVERAAELLRNRALPLADIAIACGFADQSHFTRVFAALMGTSPNTWRRAIVATEDIVSERLWRRHHTASTFTDP